MNIMDIINIFKYIFLALFTILSVFVNIQAIYYLILSLFGFGQAKKDYLPIEDQTRFLILVAAHNEEAVIGATLENLKKINYRKDLYDIYVVNDNSTDRTGEICDQYEIKHVDTIEQRFPREGVGKPAGIQYALRALGFEKLIEKYDCLMILDADNHVDPDILKELNCQFVQKGRPEAIQTYLDSKNATNSLSLGYALGYYNSNRFFQLSKYRLGLPNAIGGTGFIVRIDYLIKHGGFIFKSLTEDLELEIQIVRDGGRVLWNHFVRIYDEKPEKLKASLKQRTRWSQGHWYVAFTNCVPLMKEFFQVKGKRRWIILDQIFYLFNMGRSLHLLVALIGLVIVTFYRLIMNKTVGLLDVGLDIVDIIFGSSIFILINIFYQYFILLRYSVNHDSKLKFHFFKMFISLTYYAYTFIISQIAGFFKHRNQHTWVKTEHSKTRIEQIQLKK